jgi:hypothetical protein
LATLYTTELIWATLLDNEDPIVIFFLLAVYVRVGFEKRWTRGQFALLVQVYVMIVRNAPLGSAYPKDDELGYGLEY